MHSSSKGIKPSGGSIFAHPPTSAASILTVQLAAREFTAAHSFYTQAISLNPTSPALYSNRSAALLSMNKLSLALNDANRAIELNPAWSKAYRRKASVLDVMGKYAEALEVYSKALEVGLAEVQPDGREKVEVEIKRLVEGVASCQVPVSWVS